MPKITITQGCVFDGESHDVGSELDLADDRAAALVADGNAEFTDDSGKADDKATTEARENAAQAAAEAADAAAAEAEEARLAVEHADGRVNDGNANGGIPPADPDRAQGRAEENAAVTAKTRGAESGPPVGKTRAAKARAAKDSSAEPGAVGAEPLEDKTTGQA